MGSECSYALNLPVVQADWVSSDAALPPDAQPPILQHIKVAIHNYVGTPGKQIAVSLSASLVSHQIWRNINKTPPDSVLTALLAVGDTSYLGRRA